MSKFRLNGVEYDTLGTLMKELNRVPVLHYIELQEQASINLDEFDTRSLPWRTWIACCEFLLRRNSGQQTTFREVAAETIADDVVIPDPGDGEEGDEGKAEAPDPAGDGPSPT